MKAIKQFLLENYDTYPEQISEIRDHGIFGGSISELIYYNDIDAFYTAHEDEICTLLDNYAEDCGYQSTSELVCGNPKFPINTARDYSRHSVAIAIELVADQILSEREE